MQVELFYRYKNYKSFNTTSVPQKMTNLPFYRNILPSEKHKYIPYFGTVEQD